MLKELINVCFVKSVGWKKQDVVETWMLKDLTVVYRFFCLHLLQGKTHFSSAVRNCQENWKNVHDVRKKCLMAAKKKTRRKESWKMKKLKTRQKRRKAEKLVFNTVRVERLLQVSSTSTRWTENLTEKYLLRLKQAKVWKKRVFCLWCVPKFKHQD